MYVIVAGGGMVGGGLVHKLMEKKHDVVLIETNKDLCEKVYSQTGVVAINGGATVRSGTACRPCHARP